jgi:hypothetical protein
MGMREIWSSFVGKSSSLTKAARAGVAKFGSVTRLKMKISAIEAKLESKYLELGKLAADLYVKDRVTRDLFSGNVREILDLQAQLASKKQEVAAMMEVSEKSTEISPAQGGSERKEEKK